MTFVSLSVGVPSVLFLVLVAWPLVQSVQLSFTDWNGYTTGFNWVGFVNYTDLFADSQFRQALLNNVLLLIVLPIFTIAVSLTLAILITIGGPTTGNVRGIKGAGFYRVVSFFPYVIPAVVIGVLFQQIFKANNGLLNGILSLSGIKVTFDWLGEANTVLWTVAFAMAWSVIGFYMVLFIAAIKAIPAEILEALRIDGAGRWTTALQILPLIRDNVKTAYVYIGFMALDAFTIVATLTPSGGINNRSEVVAHYLLFQYSQKAEVGYASAMGVVLAAVTMLFALITLSRGNKDKVEM
ncbi:sugar ABC transporter permease [Micrococcales bacterium 31B]|nr:sugar ABC transporter permease [Micrococcales bacterium 31B]